MGKSNLEDRKCKPCEGDEPPLKGKALEELAEQLGEGWKVVEEDHLKKKYDFNDFREALAFTNAVGSIAEREDHHPDLALGWGRVEVSLKTHKIDGLSENDFILAAKADRAFSGMDAS